MERFAEKRSAVIGVGEMRTAVCCTGRGTLALFDVDGTLREQDRHMGAEMARDFIALASSLEDGRIGVVSGASVRSLNTNFVIPLVAQMREVGFYPNVWAVANGGSRVMAVRAGQLVHEYDEPSLSGYEKMKIIDAVQKKGMIEMLGGVLRKTPRIYDRGSQMAIALIPDATSEERSGFDPDGTYRDTWIADLTNLVPKTLIVERSGRTTVTVRNSVDKLFAVEELAKRNGWDLSRLVYVGDEMHKGGNDYPMVRGAERYGYSCVVVSGPAETEIAMSTLMELRRKEA